MNVARTVPAIASINTGETDWGVGHMEMNFGEFWISHWVRFRF